MVGLQLALSPACFVKQFVLIRFRCPSRKSSSWHTSLRIRKKSEKKEKEAKKETKLENGYRKSRDGLANKVSVKVSFTHTAEDTRAALCFTARFFNLT